VRKTNKQLIKALTTDSIEQAFVIEAVEQYCQTVLADDTDWGNQTLINKDLWQVIARRGVRLIEEHYK